MRLFSPRRLEGTKGGGVFSGMLGVIAAMPVSRARVALGALLGAHAETQRRGGGNAETIQIGARVPRRKALAAQHFARRAPHIAAMHEGWIRWLGYAQAETLRKLEVWFSQGVAAKSADAICAAAGAGVAADLVFDLSSFSKGVLGMMRDETLDAMESAGEEFLQEVGKDDVFSLPDPVAREHLAARENLLKDVPDEMHAAIEEELQRGLDAGEPLEKLARRITNKFAEIEAGRAETIASTETAAAYGFSREVAMKQAGIQFKTWLTSGLPNVRTAHRDAEDDPRNAQVPIDEPFHVGGELLRYPGDPAGSAENVINCHCVALAVEAKP